jgi:radical SAM/Cys-rich protein
MIELTLNRRQDRLADPLEQRRILDSLTQIPDFSRTLTSKNLPQLAAAGVEVLQVNVGKVCNQTCRHCHVDAGPDRQEMMSREVAEACLRVLTGGRIPTLDITGGAPEMNPQFRRLVSQAAEFGHRVIDRCNLTILVAPGFSDLPEFLAAHRVEVVASLPCYLEENVDRQRGRTVFQRSLAALKRLNELGYGMPGSPLPLTLVFNPGGPSLAPSQERLESDYRRELRSRYGIEFTRLFTITNMPISRFLDDLLQSGQLEAYMRLLVDAFNPATVDGLMCRTTLSVDWQGRLYDCDFNQMLEFPVAPDLPQNVLNLREGDLLRIAHRRIHTGRHCYGCTAGAGSSCTGSLVG